MKLALAFLLATAYGLVPAVAAPVLDLPFVQVGLLDHHHHQHGHHHHDQGHHHDDHHHQDDHHHHDHGHRHHDRGHHHHGW